MLPPTLRDGLSLGDLADLLVAWAEGEVSEGRLAELTGLDRVSLRGLKQAAVERAIRLAQSEAGRAAWLRPLAAVSANMTDPPDSSAGMSAATEPGTRGS